MISIIIPAYNAEKYIIRSLECCLKQDFQNIEILVINDGSIDSTQQLVERYTHKDQRIRLINKPNGGLVSAREEALHHVQGDFVFFLDADDIIDTCTISVLSQYCAEYDIIISDFVLEHENGKRLPIQHINKLKYGNGNLGTYNNYLSKSVTASLCGRLIRTTFLEDFSTPLDITIGEDVITNLILTKNHNPRLKIVNIGLYHYIQYSNSMIHTKSKETLLNRIKYSNWVIDFFEKEGLNQNQQIMDNLSYHVLDEYYSFLRDGGKPAYCPSYAQKISSKFLRKHILKRISLWKRFILRMYEINPLLGSLSRNIFVTIRNLIQKR